MTQPQQNAWDVAYFRHEDDDGFVSGWYAAIGDGMSVPVEQALDASFPFYSVVRLSNGQIIRVRPKT